MQISQKHKELGNGAIKLTALLQPTSESPVELRKAAKVLQGILNDVVDVLGKENRYKIFPVPVRKNPYLDVEQGSYEDEEGHYILISILPKLGDKNAQSDAEKLSDELYNRCRDLSEFLTEVYSPVMSSWQEEKAKSERKWNEKHN